MFGGFDTAHVDTGDATLYVRHGGDGPAVILLHGHPRTHATWHAVAARLVDRFTVICPDLRGYGRSSKPPTDAAHTPYGKRAMAGDIASLAEKLGHDRYFVVGHDRGAYVAQRLAVDFTQVAGLIVMDAVPIGEALSRCDAKFAAAWWHWFFLGQTSKPAEDWINLDPDRWYKVDSRHMGPDAYEDLRAALRNPDVVHAMCEDYRAGLTVDREADDDDQAAGRKIACPMWVLWAERDDMETLYGDPIAVWEQWADDIRGGVSIPSGHHMAEEAPEELADRIEQCFADL